METTPWQAPSSLRIRRTSLGPISSMLSTAVPAHDADRYIRKARGHGSNPKSAEGHPYDGPDRRSGRAQRLDGRDHGRRSGLRAVFDCYRTASAQRRMVVRKKHGGRLVRNARGVERPSTSHGRRAVRPVPGDGRQPARIRAPESAGYLSDLRNAGPDDSVHQRFAGTGYKNWTGVWPAIGVRRLVGTRSRPANRACRFPVLRNVGMAASWKTIC